MVATDAPPTGGGKTINVFGKKIPKTMVLVGGAAAAGYVGFRWFTAGREGTPVTAVDPTAGTGTPPVDVPTDSTSFDIFGTGPPPSTNADWTQLAITRAEAVGIDGAPLAAALGKYLTRQPLTTVEAGLVRTAIGLAGLPPQNTPPYTIIEAPSGTGGVVPVTVLPLAPSSVRATGGRAHISATWPAVSGATSYEARLVRGFPQGTGGTWANVGLRTSKTWIQQVAKTSTYSVEVRAKNKNGTGPPRRSNPVMVTH